MKSTSFSTSTHAKPENLVKGQQKITQCFRKQTSGAPVPYMLQKPCPMAMEVWEQADTSPSMHISCTAVLKNPTALFLLTQRDSIQHFTYLSKESSPGIPFKIKPNPLQESRTSRLAMWRKLRTRTQHSWESTGSHQSDHKTSVSNTEVTLRLILSGDANC